MGKLAAHFKGGFSIPYQMTLDWFEVLKWEKVYDFQRMEERVIEDMSYDDKGNKKKLPSNSTIREEVERRIEEHEKNYEEKLKEYGK